MWALSDPQLSHVARASRWACRTTGAFVWEDPWHTGIDHSYVLSARRGVRTTDGSAGSRTAKRPGACSCTPAPAYWAAAGKLPMVRSAPLEPLASPPPNTAATYAQKVQGRGSQGQKEASSPAWWRRQSGSYVRGRATPSLECCVGPEDRPPPVQAKVLEWV